MAAYTEHARNIGEKDPKISAFVYEALAATLDDSLSVDDLVALTLKNRGLMAFRQWPLLDKANTSRYGHPEMTTFRLVYARIRRS